MKKNLLPFLILFVSVSFLSCKKENNSSGDEYYFKVTVDGQSKTFTNVLCELGPDIDDPSLTDLVVNGDNGTDMVSFHVQRNGIIGTGIYKTDNPDLFCSMDYITNFATQNFNYYVLGNVEDKPESKYIITITSISDKTIKGTISGNVLYETFTNAEKFLISGEFSAKRY